MHITFNIATAAVVLGLVVTLALIDVTFSDY